MCFYTFDLEYKEQNEENNSIHLSNSLLPWICLQVTLADEMKKPWSGNPRMHNGKNKMNVISQLILRSQLGISSSWIAIDIGTISPEFQKVTRQNFKVYTNMYSAIDSTFKNKKRYHISKRTFLEKLKTWLFSLFEENSL